MQKKITYELRTIGTIEAANGEFAVRVHEDYKEALKEIEGFSHLVLFWGCHLLDNEEMRKYTVAAKPYKQGPDEIGFFGLPHALQLQVNVRGFSRLLGYVLFLPLGRGGIASHQ